MAWTAPDPLVIDSKTRSIYITELQDALQEKRIAIGQIAYIGLVNQNVGKTMQLQAISQLETLVNKLAEDYGYVGGITNIALLGRPYVIMPNNAGKKVTSFPIINDLRQVLDSLVKQLHEGVVTFIQGNTSNGDNFKYIETKYNADTNELDIVSSTDSIVKDSALDLFAYLLMDSNYYYHVGTSASTAYHKIVRRNRADGTDAGSSDILQGLRFAYPVIDSDFIYLLGYRYEAATVSKLFIVDKVSLTLKYTIDLMTLINYYDGPWNIIVDNEYIYLLNGNNEYDAGEPTFETAIIAKLNKNLSYPGGVPILNVTLNALNHIDLNLATVDTRHTQIGLSNRYSPADETHIYAYYGEAAFGGSGGAFANININKSTLQVDSTTNVNIQNEFFEDQTYLDTYFYGTDFVSKEFIIWDEAQLTPVLQGKLNELPSGDGFSFTINKSQALELFQ